MNQKTLEASIRAVLLECMPIGLSYPVIAGNQPTGQGRIDGIYFFRIGDGKRGWQIRKYKTTNTAMALTESQWSESEYQFSALIKDDLNDDNQLLAGDVADIVRSTVSGLTMVEKLAKLGIGVQRPSNILNPAFVNDKDQYDFQPNFTVVFSHKRDITQAVISTNTIEVKLIAI